MTDDDDIDGLAAEYVLGSLRLSERKAIDARRKQEVALSKAIAAWEVRLAPLSDRLPGLAPSPELYAKILARIGDVQTSQAIATIASRRRRVLVASMCALAACLLLVFGWIVLLRSTSPSMLVAQLHRATGQATADEALLPAFAVAIDANTRTLTIRPVEVRPIAGRSYALWLVQQGGATPILLGRISPSEPTTLPWITDRPLRDFVNSSLTISIEDEGNSPPRLPSAPITFVGKLVGSGGPER